MQPGGLFVACLPIGMCGAVTKHDCRRFGGHTMRCRMSGDGKLAQTSPAARTGAMQRWLHRYNTERPQAALAGRPALTRLNWDNLHRNDT